MCTLMFHLLNNVINGQEQFECFGVLAEFAFERVKRHNKGAYRTVSQHQNSNVFRNVGVMDNRRQEGTERAERLCSVELSPDAREYI